MHDPRKGICGKSCWTSEKQAKQGARAILRRGSNAHRFRPYFCKNCHAWHITSSRDQFK